LFIVALTLIFVPLFGWMRKRGKGADNRIQIWNGLIYFRTFGIGDGVCDYVCAFCLYTQNISLLVMALSYFVFTISEIFLSPIGLSLVSKLAPARLTALMMGGWFLSTSIGGKIAGVMTTFWDDFTDKKMFFLYW
jgi:POT family proton-dependent oligopeptide transporter